MKRTIALALMLGTSTLAGCAALLARDETGKPVEPKAVDPAKVAAAQQTATTIGGFFGPIGQAVGVGFAGVIAAGAAAYAAKLKGEIKGYNEGSLDAGKPLASATAAK